MYRLVFLTGPHQGRRLAVQKGDLVIGHNADCHVQLHGPAVASRHAILEQRPDGFFIKAIDPAGALSVNGVETREERLKHGDEIDIAGERLLFQLFEGDGGPQKRRSGKFHGLTFVAVTAILLLQILILAGLFIFWRMDPIHIPVVEEVEELEESPKTGMTDEETAIVERRLRARTGEPEEPAMAVDEGHLRPAPAAPFDLISEWIVTPEYEPWPDSVATLDEAGSTDVFTPEEE